MAKHFIAVERNGSMVFEEQDIDDYGKLIKKTDDNVVLFTQKDKCDKYDYLIAVVCGAIGGLVDVFLVGSPGNSVLGGWTDKQVDNVVMQFSKMTGWHPKSGNEKNVKSAIGHLERKFKVNYDKSVSSSASAVGLTPRNHHMKSLAHSPDIIGLFFSILNQFTSTSTFLSDGRLITMDTETFELNGSNFISKIFCGIYNWIGHLMSDVAGSSGSSGHGMGIVMPFYELFNLCDFGEFNIGKEKGTMADVAMKAFENGYDARFALTMAIPVAITDLSIKLLWSLRRYLQFKLPIKECIPTMKHPDLRIMLIVGNGTLCVIDGIDAGVKSGGDIVTFFMRLNLVAWFKLVKMVVKEVLIRVGIPSFENNIEALKRASEGIVLYLDKLKEIDIEAYKKEVERFKKWDKQLNEIKDDIELNRFLLETYDKFNLELPWKGDFGTFMSDKSNHLVFS